MALLPKRPRISSTASCTFSIAMRCWTLSNSVSCSTLSLGERSMERTVTALTFVFQEYRSLKLRNAAAAISEGSCVLKCKSQSSLLPACFLSCGLCQHTCCCALRHERQANAALTCADQQFRAARADQERILLTQIHRAVRDTIAVTAHKR